MSSNTNGIMKPRQTCWVLVTSPLGLPQSRCHGFPIAILTFTARKESQRQPGARRETAGNDRSRCQSLGAFCTPQTVELGLPTIHFINVVPPLCWLRPWPPNTSVEGGDVAEIFLQRLPELQPGSCESPASSGVRMRFGDYLTAQHSSSSNVAALQHVVQVTRWPRSSNRA